MDDKTICKSCGKLVLIGELVYKTDMCTYEDRTCRRCNVKRSVEEFIRSTLLCRYCNRELCKQRYHQKNPNAKHKASHLMLPITYNERVRLKSHTFFFPIFKKKLNILCLYKWYTKEVIRFLKLRRSIIEDSILQVLDGE